MPLAFTRKGQRRIAHCHWQRQEDEAKKGTANVSCVNTVNICVKDLTGEKTMYIVKNTTPFGSIMKAYARRKGVSASALRFLLDGEQIEPYQTIAGLDLNDEDQVDCILNASGC